MFKEYTFFLLKYCLYQYNIWYFILSRFCFLQLTQTPRPFVSDTTKEIRFWAIKNNSKLLGIITEKINQVLAFPQWSIVLLNDNYYKDCIRLWIDFLLSISSPKSSSPIQFLIPAIHHITSMFLQSPDTLLKPPTSRPKFSFPLHRQEDSFDSLYRPNTFFLTTRSQSHPPTRHTFFITTNMYPRQNSNEDLRFGVYTLSSVWPVVYSGKYEHMLGTLVSYHIVSNFSAC